MSAIQKISKCNSAVLGALLTKDEFLVLQFDFCVRSISFNARNEESSTLGPHTLGPGVDAHVEGVPKCSSLTEISKTKRIRKISVWIFMMALMICIIVNFYSSRSIWSRSSEVINAKPGLCRGSIEKRRDYAGQVEKPLEAG